MKALFVAALIALTAFSTASAGQIRTEDWKKINPSAMMECLIDYDVSDEAYRECRIDQLEPLHRAQYERRFAMRECVKRENIDKPECRGFQEVLDEKMDKELIVLHRIFD